MACEEYTFDVDVGIRLSRIQFGDEDDFMEVCTTLSSITSEQTTNRRPTLQLLSHNDFVQSKTLVIPFPYTRDCAEWWTNFNEEKFRESGRPYNFAIRNSEGTVMGVIGFHILEDSWNGTVEVGYWIGERYRNVAEV